MAELQQPADLVVGYIGSTRGIAWRGLHDKALRGGVIFVGEDVVGAEGVDIPIRPAQSRPERPLAALTRCNAGRDTNRNGALLEALPRRRAGQRMKIAPLLDNPHRHPVEPGRNPRAIGVDRVDIEHDIAAYG